MVFILIFTLLVVVFAIFYFFGWSFLNWRDGYKDAGVRMSFEEFRRIYELAPSRWDRYSNYIYHRKERIPDDRGDSYETYISTSIVMETLFDFWRLLLWLKMRTRQHEREARFKEEKASLKSLSIMVERDVENIRKKLEEEEHKAENLRQEIIDRLGGNK